MRDADRRFRHLPESTEPAIRSCVWWEDAATGVACGMADRPIGHPPLQLLRARGVGSAISRRKDLRLARRGLAGQDGPADIPAHSAPHGSLRAIRGWAQPNLQKGYSDAPIIDDLAAARAWGGGVPRARRREDEGAREACRLVEPSAARGASTLRLRQPVGFRRVGPARHPWRPLPCARREYGCGRRGPGGRCAP